MEPMVVADPCSSVVAELAPARFLRWCEQLADIVAGGGGPLVALGGDDVIERADDLLSTLAHTWGLAYAVGSLECAAWDVAIGKADTYAAAQLLARSGLPARSLGRLVDRVLMSWCFGESPCTLERHAPVGERTPEVLLAALTGEPAAARRLLGEWEDEALDLLIGWDPDAVGPMLLAACSGVADVDADDAETGRLLAKVMSYLWSTDPDELRASADGSRLTDWLGALVGPWQLHLLAQSPGWEWPGLDATAVLAWVASNPQSADALSIWWSRLTETASVAADDRLD
jgi:hypothetical protein